jgi:hypothetical protein
MNSLKEYLKQHLDAKSKDLLVFNQECILDPVETDKYVKFDDYAVTLYGTCSDMSSKDSTVWVTFDHIGKEKDVSINVKLNIPKRDYDDLNHNNILRLKLTIAYNKQTMRIGLIPKLTDTGLEAWDYFINRHDFEFPLYN